MDHVLERGNFTSAEIRRINYCRLWLQALTVSDIATATGNKLAQGVRDGQTTLWSGVTKMHKTNQANPNQTTWRLWSRAMNLLANSKDDLYVPLRQWIVPIKNQRQVWAVYYDPETDTVMFPKMGTYECHKQVSGVFSYEYHGYSPSLSDSAYPISLIEYPSGWKVERYNSYCPKLPRTNPSSFQSFCSLLDNWEAQLLSNVSLQYDPFNIVALIEASSFIACSDGSAVALEGTYGWALCSEDGTRLAHGSGPVDGHDPRSFRAEGQGMLSVVCLLRRLLEWCCSSETITGILATDNTGVIDRVRSQSQLKYPIPNAVFKPDWDVIQAIVQTQQSFSISTTYQHVKGHQDDDTPLDELSLLAQLNVEADKYAGDFRRQFGSYRPLIPLSPTRPVALDLMGKTIHRGFKQAIRETIHGNHLLEAMQIRYNWQDGVLDTIDWEAHRQATQAQTGRKTHYIKLCHELLPTGSLVCKYGQGLPNYCSLCRTPNEDFHHVLQCHHPTRVKWRNGLLTSLTKVCHNIRTDPILLQILVDGLKSWLHATPFTTSEIPSEYLPLLQEQTAVGWDHVFQGRITKKWAEAQQSYYDGFPKVKGRDGAAWSRKILCEVFTHWNKLWDVRNEDLHGKDTTSQARASKEQAFRELDLLYALKNKVLQRDTQIFYESLDQHKLQPTRSIRQWINTYQPLILKSVKDAKTKSLIHVRPLTTYFGTG